MTGPIVSGLQANIDFERPLGALGALAEGARAAITEAHSAADRFKT